MGDAKDRSPKKFCDMDLEMGDAKEYLPDLTQHLISLLCGLEATSVIDRIIVQAEMT